MAIQFPNFLAANTPAPDYSGIGDSVGNYYTGKNMAHDDLIKKIQANFAKPTAEAGLAGKKLANTKLELDIANARLEAKQQKEIETAIRNAMNGQQPDRTTGEPVAQFAAAVPSAAPQQGITPEQTGLPPLGQPQQQPGAMDKLEDHMLKLKQMNPRLAQMLQQGMNQGGQGEQGAVAPNAPIASPTAPNGATPPPALSSSLGQDEQQAEAESATRDLIAGDPSKYGIDRLWANNPSVRKSLKDKHGYNRTEKLDFDKKTGETRIVTHEPSGRVTEKIIKSSKTAGDEGIPLTNKMISKHQNVVSSVDNVLPILKKLEAFENPSNIYIGEWDATHNQKNFQRLVNSAKESMMGAFALNPSDSGLKTALDQLTIGGWEDADEYHEAIGELIKDLKKRREYSNKEIKRSNSIQPVALSLNASTDYSDLGSHEGGGS